MFLLSSTVCMKRTGTYRESDKSYYCIISLRINWGRWSRWRLENLRNERDFERLQPKMSSLFLQHLKRHKSMMDRYRLFESTWSRDWQGGRIYYTSPVTHSSAPAGREDGRSKLEDNQSATGNHTAALIFMIASDERQKCQHTGRERQGRLTAIT